MKHILMACGAGVCTSAAVCNRVCEFLNEQGYWGQYDITKCSLADVPSLAASYDFLVAATLIPGTLNIPFVNGVPFLTGSDATGPQQKLLGFMGERARQTA